MGLNKYGQKGFEDVSGWDPLKIGKEIRELQSRQADAYQDYLATRKFLQRQIDYLQEALDKIYMISDSMTWEDMEPMKKMFCD